MALLRILAVALLFVPQRQSTDSVLKNWPHFTILVPLYDEAHMVQTLMKNLAALEYPHHKLTIIMVCEADDELTCKRVTENLRPPFQIYRAKPSYPRTKPKALNAALACAAPHGVGEIITVYDAEDRPHPYQLKAAALALHADPSLAAVQAPLGYYNEKENMLTAFFALEYAALFHVWNPALSRLGLPFTLGGTSNHIRRSILEMTGGWDSHNVTEDADLSFRISALRRAGQPMKIGCIAYGTQEEAVSTHKAWVHQRSRWLKGFLQTWAVHMRRQKTAPDGQLYKAMPRIRNMSALHITIGASLLSAFLHVPSLIIMSGLSLARTLGVVSFATPPLFYTVLGIGYGAAMLLALAGAARIQKYHLMPFIALLPIYWIFYFRAALIAAYEFVAAPAYWRKTDHMIISSGACQAVSALEQRSSTTI